MSLPSKEDMNKMMIKFPEKVPFIAIIRYENNRQSKYFVNRKSTIGNFLYLFREKRHVNSTESIFLYIDNKLPAMSTSFSVLYDKYKDKNGILNCVITKEAVYGN